MSAPLATTDELGVYLGQSVDQARAGLALQLAHDLCETVISPVPPSGKGTELGVAARLYNNATSAHQAGIGSAQVSYGAPNSSVGIGGLFLSKTDVRTLRRLAGRTGAFSIDLIPEVPPTSAPVVSNIDPDGAATGDLVRVEGYGFTGATLVTFAGVAVEFLVVDGTVIHAVVPSGVVGSVSVVVTNAIGASTAFAYTRGS